MTGFDDDPWLPLLTAETDRLLETVRSLDDAAVRRATRLPGWTVGHVITHLARNADALRDVLTSARGEGPGAMYASQAVRDGDIEAGAGRPAAEQESDLESACERLLAEIAATPPQATDAFVNRLADPGDQDPAAGFKARAVPFLRLREVVYHHVDLGCGYSFADAPDDLLARGIAECEQRLADGLPEPGLAVRTTEGPAVFWQVGAAPVEVSGPAYALLAWLTGRSDGEGLTSSAGALPALPTWG